MRNIIVYLACAAMAVWMLGSCASKEELAARRIELAKKVATALQERNFKIGVLMMYPPRGGARNVAYGYSLEVRNDSLISYLPYFGRAYDVPYGGGKGLNFNFKTSGKLPGVDGEERHAHHRGGHAERGG